jgi:hypothetical protein
VPTLHDANTAAATLLDDNSGAEAASSHPAHADHTLWRPNEQLDVISVPTKSGYLSPHRLLRSLEGGQPSAGASMPESEPPLAPELITDVRSSVDLRRVAAQGAENIELQEHLNLASADDQGGEALLPMLFTTSTLRVRVSAMSVSCFRLHAFGRAMAQSLPY